VREGSEWGNEENKTPKLGSEAFFVFSFVLCVTAKLFSAKGCLNLISQIYTFG